ncbi:MAG: hypothetical protein CL459_03585 [Acidimicrobiaceae bacterium]|nr:hypothetical protein [Acidimicrobiaceae bacterium]
MLVSRWRLLALVIPVVLALGACAQDEDAPVPATVATTTAAPPSSSLSSTTTAAPPSSSLSSTTTTAPPSSSLSSTTTTSSTVPPTTAPPRSPTTAVGGPTDVPEGFCGDLAVESARVTTALEALDPEAALPVRHLVQLRATTALLTWLAEHVPATRRYDAGTLAGVYEGIDRVLAELDVGSVTEARLRQALFGALLAEPDAAGAELDEAASRIADWVGAACGEFPMVSFVADLFAAARLAAGDEERFAVELGL